MFVQNVNQGDARPTGGESSCFFFCTSISKIMLTNQIGSNIIGAWMLALQSNEC